MKRGIVFLLTLCLLFESLPMEGVAAVAEEITGVEAVEEAEEETAIVPAAEEKTEVIPAAEEEFTIVDGVLTAYAGAGGEVVIPEGVTSIGTKVFYQNETITKVTFPESLLTIGENAFNGCTGLTEVIIPDQVTEIETSAFSGATGITKLVLGKKVTKLGVSAFWQVKNVEELTLPDQAAAIGVNISLNPKVVNIRNSAESISTQFLHFSNLETINVETGNAIFESVDGVLYKNLENGTKKLVRYPQSKAGNSYTILEGTTELGEKSCYRTLLKSVTIPEGVPHIGTSAFEGCTGLTEVRMPESLQTIGERAFYGCTGLTEVVIPDQVTEIGDSAFYEASGIKKLVLGKSVTKLGVSAFWQVKNVEELTLPDQAAAIGVNISLNPKVVNIRSSAESISTQFLHFSNLETISVEAGNAIFESVDGVLYEKLENGTKKLVRYPQNKSGDSYTILEGTTELGEKSCYRTLLKSVTIPEGVPHIGTSAFEGCTGLTEVRMPESLQTIGERAFYGCTGLTEVVIPDQVTEIGDSAFYEASGIKKLVLGKSVTKLGVSAFWQVKNVEELTLPDQAAAIGVNISLNPKVVNIRSSAESISTQFLHFSNLETISVEAGNAIFESVDGVLYEKLENGTKKLVRYPQNKSGDSYTILEGTTELGEKSCYRTLLKSVTIPEGVPHIGTSAFEGCTGLTEVRMPESLQTIGERAFYGCTGLTEVVIPDQVTEIGDSAFYEASGIKKLVLGKSVTKLGVSAFWQVKNVEELTLPDQAAAIGVNISLNPKVVNIRNSATSISTQFLHFSNLETINVEAGNAIFESVDGVLYKNLEDGTKKLVRYPQSKPEETDYSVPETVTEIGDKAFYNQTILTAVVVPKSVTVIGTDAFTGCTNMTMYGYSASAAQEYAVAKGIPFVLIDDHTHSFGDWVVVRKVSCTRDGMKYRKCDSCFYKEYEQEKAWGHNVSPLWIYVSRPTCSLGGYKAHCCTNEGCDYRRDGEKVEALGHQFTDWQIRKEASETETGKEYRTCIRCQTEETQEIPMIPVNWTETEEFGLARLHLVDEKSQPVGNGMVVFFDEEGKSYQASSGEDGFVERALPIGVYSICAYRDNKLLRNAKITVCGGINEYPDMQLSERPALTGNLTSHLMTKEEMEAVGIDTSAEGNHQIYEWVVKIGFKEVFGGMGEGEISFPFYGDMSYPGYIEWRDPYFWDIELPPGWKVTYVDREVDDEWWLKFLGPGIDHPWNGKPGWKLETEDGDVYQIRLIDEKFFVVIRGETRWLKEMFDVELFMVNNTNEAMVDCKAELEIPEGLSLAEMKTGFMNEKIQEIGRLEPGETGSVHWYVRGDEEGVYMLDARVTGTMETFGDSFEYYFSTATPLIVYAASAMEMTLYIQRYTGYKEKFKTGIEVKNVSDRPLYHVSHSITNVSQEVMQTWEHHTKSEGEKPETWTETEWDVKCSEPIGPEGTIKADVLNPGDSLTVWTEMTIINEPFLQRQLKEKLDITSKLMKVIAKNVGAGTEELTDMIFNVLSQIDVRYVVDEVIVTAGDGDSPMEIPYKIEYIKGSESKKMSVSKKLGSEVMDAIRDGMYDAAKDEALDMVISFIPGSDIYEGVKDIVDATIISTALNEYNNAMSGQNRVEVSPSGEDAQVRVWTEKRTALGRSTGESADDLVDITVIGNDTAERQPDGSIIFTGSAELEFDGKATGDAYIYMQDLSQETDNTAAVILEITEEPKAYADETGKYCFYQPGTTVTDDFVNFASESGLRFLNNDHTSVSGGEIIATGDTLQEMRNGRVDNQVVAVIPGDTDGDGESSIFDILEVSEDILGVKRLTGAYRRAAAPKEKDGADLTVFEMMDLSERVLQSRN